MTNLTEVKAVQDQDSHWYVIPADAESLFYKMEQDGESDEWEKFNEVFGKYRTGGSLNNVRLFAEL